MDLEPNLVITFTDGDAHFSPRVSFDGVKCILDEVAHDGRKHSAQTMYGTELATRRYRKRHAALGCDARLTHQQRSQLRVADALW